MTTRPGRSCWMSLASKAGLLLALSTTLTCRAESGPATLVLNETTVTAQTHAIVIPDKATPAEEYASAELRDWLTSATGECLPVTRDSDETTRAALIVGHSRRIGRDTPPVDFNALGTEGIALRTVGPSLVLAGNQRGALYAVYSFLEDNLGIRWLAPDCTVVPSDRRVIRVDDLNTSYVPRFATRALDYWSAFNQDWAARNKVNGYGYAKKGPIDAAHGGEDAYPCMPTLFWSTLRFWIPIDTYRKSHPEYFSEIDGKRITTNETDTDYCMTNPEVVDLTIAEVRKVLRANPQASVLSVSQNDHVDRYCRCARCAALTAKEEAPSAMVVELVNRVAEAIEGEFPNVKLTTLAYLWSQRPPRSMKVHRNVIVEVCPIRLSQQTPLTDSDSTYARQLRSDLEGWVNLCAPGNVKFCQYSVNYSHLYLPHPNLHVFQPNMKYFADHGAGHFYDCGSYTSPQTEFAELRAYLIAKLAWNPDADAWKLMDEFLDGYYGAAAPPIREYIRELHRQIEARSPMHFSVYASPDDGQFTHDLLDLGERKMQEATELAGDDLTIRERVAVARLPIRYARIMLASMDYRTTPDGLHLDSPLTEEVEKNLEPFLSLLDRIKATSLADVAMVNPHDWERGIRDRMRPLPFNLVTLKSKHLELKIVPDSNGRLWRMKDLATGRQLFATWGANESALDGRGYAEFALPRSMTRWKDEGCFRVVEQTSVSVTMTAPLIDGLLSTRTVTLHDDAPRVSLQTVLGNPTDKPVTTTVCTHPAFSVLDVANARFEMVADGAVAESQSMDPSALEGQGLWFKAPTGEWRLVDGSSGTTITNRFDASRVDKCLGWYDNQAAPRSATMELRFKPVVIAPGKTFGFSHSYAISHGRR